MYQNCFLTPLYRDSRVWRITSVELLFGPLTEANLLGSRLSRFSVKKVKTQFISQTKNL
jgi:hypothetical protein